MLNSDPLYSDGLPRTPLTLLERARADTEAGQQALEELIRTFRGPLLTHLTIKFRARPEQAEDWLQAFLLKKVVQNRLVTDWDQARGQFRTFLLNALDRFVLDQLDRERRQIRMPPGGFVDLESWMPTETAETQATAPDPFSIHWAVTVIAEAVHRLQKDCAAKGQQDVWEVFRLRLWQPLLEGKEPPSHQEVAVRLALADASQSSNRQLSATRKLQTALRVVIRDYASDAALAETEIQELMRVLAQAPKRIAELIADVQERSRKAAELRDQLPGTGATVAVLLRSEPARLAALLGWGSIQVSGELDG